MGLLKKCFSLSLLLGALAGAGCGTWIGNPPDKSSESNNPPKAKDNNVVLVFSTPKTATFDITNEQGTKLGTITLTENRHVIRDIYIFNEIKGAEPLFRGPYVIDLLNGQVTPAPTASYLEAGTYNQASFTTHVLQAGEIPELPADDRLIGNTTSLIGSISVSGLTLPFNILFDWSKELTVRNSEVEGQTPEPITAGDDHSIVIEIDYSKWFVVQNITDLTQSNKLEGWLQDKLQNNTSFSIRRE